MFANNTIKFLSTDKRLLDHYPPIYSRDLQRSFLKKLNVNYKSNLDLLKTSSCPFQRFTNTARCPGIVDIINAGYVFRLHRDIRIITNGDGRTFSWEVLTDSKQDSLDISYFGPEQFGDHLNLPENTLKTLIKINLPWIVKSKKYNLLMTDVSFVEENRFSVAEGILDTDKGIEINPILYWHVLNGSEILKAGTPICQIIPIQKIATPKFYCDIDSENLYQKLIDFNYRRFMTNNFISPEEYINQK